MKIPLITCMLALSGLLHAQVEVDQPILLTGGTGNRSVRQLEAPVNGTDAVNKDYVDAAVSATGGDSSPTMISAESATSMNFGAALRYCNALNEGGFTDWHLPNEKELFYVLSKGGVTVPSNTSSNPIWFAGDWVGYGGNSWDSRCAFRLSDGTYGNAISLSVGNYHVRCVR